MTRVCDDKTGRSKISSIEEEELLNKSKSILNSLDQSAHKISSTEIDLLERYNSRGSDRFKKEKSSVDDKSTIAKKFAPVLYNNKAVS